MIRRLQTVIRNLTKKNLDAFLVTSSPNIFYLTGYPSRDSWLLVSNKQTVFFTDGRYTQEARKALAGSVRVLECRDSLARAVAEATAAGGIQRLGFEARHLTVAAQQALQKERKALLWIPADGLLEELRQIKTEEELVRIREASRITLEALRFAKSRLIPGIREIDLAAELECWIRLQGAQASAFDIIVASGPHSSYPHHLTGRRIIRKNDCVLIDMGVDYQGYKSDLTRVFFLGKIDILAQRIYRIILKAQEKALRAIRPGMQLKEIDRVAREYIATQGFGAAFSHGLGHGIGVEVHEAPKVSKKSEEKAIPGMVFTVEPGIYLPGKFGCRIEDMVLVTKKGCEV